MPDITDTHTHNGGEASQATNAAGDSSFAPMAGAGGDLMNQNGGPAPDPTAPSGNDMGAPPPALGGAVHAQ